VIHLDEIPPARIGAASWKPIRSLLDIRSFGVNAYVADAGDALFDEHDETEAGAGRQRHQELYVVLAGQATFACGSSVVDAPAGTLVFLENPAERRAAHATAPATTVLAVGGPVGEPYEVAPWEGWFLARREEQLASRDERPA
jgi:hypothetical protein